MDTIAVRIETPAAQPQERLNRLLWLRLAAGLLLLFALLTFKVRASEIAAAVSSSTMGWIVLAGSLHAAGLLFSACRWRMLLLSQGRRAPLSALLRLYLAAGFFNYVLPARVSGDFYRVAGAKNISPSLFTRIAVVSVEGFSSICALLLISAAALALDPSMPIHVHRAAFSALCAGAASIAFLLFSRRLHERLKTWAAGAPRLLQAAGVLSRFAHARWKVSAAFLLSLLLQLNVILYYYWICRGLGAAVSFSHLCLTVPLVVLVQLLPLTPNSIGVREVTSVFLLGHIAGVAAPQTLALCLWDYVLSFAYALLGGILYLTRNEMQPPRH